MYVAHDVCIVISMQVSFVVVVVWKCPSTAITDADRRGPKRGNPAMRDENGRAHC